MEVQPIAMGEVFDRWLANWLEARLATGALKESTSVLYRSLADSKSATDVALRRLLRINVGSPPT